MHYWGDVIKKERERKPFIGKGMQVGAKCTEGEAKIEV